MTGGFGALGEFALGEGGYSVDMVVRPAVIDSSSELLPAHVYAGQIRRRSTSGTWGEGALGEFSLGEGPETLNTGVAVDPEVLTGALGELLDPTIRTGASVLPGVVGTISELLAPDVRSGVRIEVDVIESTSQLLNPATNLGVVIFLGLVEGAAAEVLNPTITTGASVLPVARVSVSSGGWGDGALGEFALGEGPPSKANAPVLTSRATLLNPEMRAGTSAVIPAPLTGTGELLAPIVSAGKRVDVGLITGAPAEVLEAALRIGTSVIPGVITGSPGLILIPMVSAGKSVMPSIILTANSYILNPELDARPRRIWKQAIAC